MLLDGFFHGLGHGVGVEVHEEPQLDLSGGVLQAGDVVTVKPGVYRQGYGGVRLGHRPGTTTAQRCSRGIPSRLSPSADPIAAEADRLVEEWRAACRIPSVSGDRGPIEEMARGSSAASRSGSTGLSSSGRTTASRSCWRAPGGRAGAADRLLATTCSRRATLPPGTAIPSAPTCATALSSRGAPATTRRTSPRGCRRSTSGSRPTRARRRSRSSGSARAPRRSAALGSPPCSSATRTGSRRATASGRASSGVTTAARRSRSGVAGSSPWSSRCACWRPTSTPRSRRCSVRAVDAHAGARQPRRRGRQRPRRRVPRRRRGTEPGGGRRRPPPRRARSGLGRAAPPGRCPA